MPLTFEGHAYVRPLIQHMNMEMMVDRMEGEEKMSGATKELSFYLDPSGASDIMRLALCSDVDSFKRLITDTYSWLGEVFLNNPNPTDAELKTLLGPNFSEVTLEFFYPITVTEAGQENIVVQLLLGTNVLTVRTMLPGGLENNQPAIDGPINITLYAPVSGSNQGLAYCHHDFGETEIDEILKRVAEIVLDPFQHMELMALEPNKIIQKINNVEADAMPPATTVNFMLASDAGGVSNLRFLFQRHRILEANLLDPDPGPTPLPCIKPSGAYTQDEDGVVNISIDTIAFVDYAPVPPPPPPTPEPTPSPTPTPDPGGAPGAAPPSRAQV